MSDLPAFDEVHVVSDLHMGGRAGFQAFRETLRLAHFIRRVANQRAGGTLALVLNGDVFDTLAEDIPGWIAVDEARAVVRRIIRDPSFAPVWQALADFVRLPGRILVFVIGNHDLELALPTVQRLLLETLAGADLTARARIEFSTTGGGYACRVGGARVFCTHGNEVDGWNYNRYEDLARLGRRLNAGLSMSPSEWRPNAGTRLVKEVMNKVKQRHAWIDLLKPETSAAVGALLVLDPSQAGRLLQIAGVMAGAVWHGGRDARSRLAAPDGLGTEGDGRETGGGPHGPPSASGAATRFDLQREAALLGPNLRAFLAVGALPADSADDLLATAERHLAEPGSRSAIAPGAPLGAEHGGWRRLRDQAAAPEALRHALLDWLQDDKSFEPTEPDDTSRRLCASIDPAVDFIVAGHTHLERAIDRGDGRAYFNTGTWMRLLRLTPAMLATPRSFAPAWQVLADGNMAAIDAACIESLPFVLNRTSSVAIRRATADDGSGAEQVVGELLHVEGDGSGEPLPIRRFVRRAAA